MNKTDFTVTVKMDGDIFKQFAWFDTFRLQRRWISPAVFSGIMLLFSLIAFSQVNKVGQAALLGSVLLGVGVLLPTVYFLSFYRSLRAQIKKLSLSAPRHVYTVYLGRERGVEITAGSERGTFRWDALFAAYRTKRCIYLYVLPRRAYLLPNEQIKGGSDALWALLSEMMPASKLHNGQSSR